jgi:hypothetical protein
MNKAIEIPMYASGLTVNVGRDGVWLHFTSEEGVYTSINVDVMAEEKSSIISKGLRCWADDRRKQANQIIEDNGQFGVGA